MQSTTDLLNVWTGKAKELTEYSDYYQMNKEGEIIATISRATIVETVKIRSTRLSKLHLIHSNVHAIYLSDVKCEGIEISNSTIHEIIVDIDSGIEYLKLNYSNVERVVIVNSRINNLTIYEVKKLDSIEAHAAQINNFRIGHTNINEVAFDTNCNIGNLTMSSSQLSRIDLNKSKIDLIHLEGTLISTRIALWENTTIDRIEIDTQSKICSFIAKESHCARFIVKNESSANFYISMGCNFGPVEIYGKSKVGSLSVANDSQTGYISIKEESSLEHLWIYESSRTGVISSYKSTVGNISIANSKVFGITLEFLTAESKQLLIDSAYVKNILLSLDKPYRVSIVNFSRIHELNLTRTVVSRDVIMHFSDTEINRLVLDSFINQGTVTFNNLVPVTEYSKFKTYGDEHVGPLFEEERQYQFETIKRKSELRIVNSDVGKMQLIGSNLRTFDHFVFLNSKMLDVFIAGSTLPELHQIGTIDKHNSANCIYPTVRPLLKVMQKALSRAERKKIANVQRWLTKDFKRSKLNRAKMKHLIEQQRLAMGQFKKIYENRGDVVTSSIYQAYELECYRSYLKISEAHNFKEWINKKSELINLGLNRYSSYHGNNWIRAALVTLIVNSSLYSWYCYGMGFRLGNDLNLFWTLASYSPEFLNPLRKADFLKDIVETTNSARAIDYFSRIVIAYFIYQTIQAFRKFGKKAS